MYALTFVGLVILVIHHAPHLHVVWCHVLWKAMHGIGT